MKGVKFCPICGKKSEIVQGQDTFGVLWETLHCQNKRCGAISSILRDHAATQAKQKED